MLIRLDDLDAALVRDPSLRRGCVIDTNVLFAASFPLDTFNEWAEGVFKILHAHEVPIYTNHNVRSEFIELNRRVMIPEGLLELYSNLAGTLDSHIEAQLKSLKTRRDKAAGDNKTFKLSDMDIKRYRRMLEEFTHPSGANAWDLFCNDYFYPYIKNVWEDAVRELKIQFLGTREIESAEHFETRPQWEEMMRIIGKSGIGSTDAMIVNLFIQSKYSLIVTTDGDVAAAVAMLKADDKHILAPD